MESAVIFVDEFKLLTTSYTSDQIFNSDETGLYYRTLSDKTLGLKNQLQVTNKSRKTSQSMYAQILTVL